MLKQTGLEVNGTVFGGTGGSTSHALRRTCGTIFVRL